MWGILCICFTRFDGEYDIFVLQLLLLLLLSLSLVLFLYNLALLRCVSSYIMPRMVQPWPCSRRLSSELVLPSLQATVHSPTFHHLNCIIHRGKSTSGVKPPMGNSWPPYKNCCCCCQHTHTHTHAHKFKVRRFGAHLRDRQAARRDIERGLTVEFVKALSVLFQW
jgi:hypothetical protein